MFLNKNAFKLDVKHTVYIFRFEFERMNSDDDSEIPNRFFGIVSPKRENYARKYGES